MHISIKFFTFKLSALLNIYKLLSWNSIISFKTKIVNIVEFHEIKIFIKFIIIVELHDIGGLMNLNEATKHRILEVCKQKKTTIAEACLNGGASSSSIYDLFKNRTKSPTIITLKRFCLGAGITLEEFFSKDYFNDPEDEE